MKSTLQRLNIPGYDFAMYAAVDVESLGDNDFVIVEWSEKGRTMSQNATFHWWVNHAAKFFKLDPEAMKAVFKHMFLGYEDVVVSDKLTIPGQLKHTSDQGKPEMHYFMSQVDAWCADKGCLLPHPADSEYQKYKEANQ